LESNPGIKSKFHICLKIPPQVLPKFSCQSNEKIQPIAEKIWPVTKMMKRVYCNCQIDNFISIASYKNANVVQTFLWFVFSSPFCYQTFTIKKSSPFLATFA